MDEGDAQAVVGLLAEALAQQQAEDQDEQQRHAQQPAPLSLLWNASHSAGVHSATARCGSWLACDGTCGSRCAGSSLCTCSLIARSPFASPLDIPRTTPPGQGAAVPPDRPRHFTLSP